MHIFIMWLYNDVIYFLGSPRLILNERERERDKGGPRISSISFSRFITQTFACSLVERLSDHTKPALNALATPSITNTYEP